MRWTHALCFTLQYLEWLIKIYGVHLWNWEERIQYLPASYHFSSIHPPYYRALSCMKIGNISPQIIKGQRKRQKVKHKLKFTLNAKSATTCRSAPSWTDSSLVSGLFTWVQEKAYVKSRWLLLWAERLKCYRKLKRLLNIENRLIISDPFLDLLHLQLQELARLWRLEWKLVLLLA